MRCNITNGVSIVVGLMLCPCSRGIVTVSLPITITCLFTGSWLGICARSGFELLKLVAPLGMSCTSNYCSSQGVSQLCKISD